METKYRSDYLNWGSQQSGLCLRPQSGKLMGGGTFFGTSVYRNDFQGKGAPTMKSYQVKK